MSFDQNIPNPLVRDLWMLRFTRINGLRTLNLMADVQEEDGVVPEPEQMPQSWKGRWGEDGGYTFVCLPTGDLFFAELKPDEKLAERLCMMCPNTSQERIESQLRVPYFNGERLYLEEVSLRFVDPYASVE